ncbi:hypothetical protein RFI_34591, partial [Reticulomyxa filosa]
KDFAKDLKLPPEEAFGMPQQYLVVNPLEGIHEGHVELKMKGVIQGKDDKVHIIVTPFEQEAMNKLNDRLGVVVNLIEGIESSFDNLDSCAGQVKDQIRKKIALVVDSLKDKQEIAKSEAKKLESSKITTLKVQAKTLSDHQGAINTVEFFIVVIVVDFVLSYTTNFKKIKK